VTTFTVITQQKRHSHFQKQTALEMLLVLVIMDKSLLLTSEVSLVPTCSWFLNILFVVGYGLAHTVFCIVFSSKWV